MKRLALFCLAVAGFCVPAVAADFYPISSVSSSTAATDLWPVTNLIQGPGPGYAAAAPHNKNLTGDQGNWVTDACGFPCDYPANRDAPVLTFDLGADVALTEISTWGYTTSNANGVKEFNLMFATSAEGTAGFGTSITYNPTFTMPLDDVARTSNPFAQKVNARFVKMTLTDNFFQAPGDGSQGEIPGGDRVGLGEVAFAVPEPSSLSLFGLAAVGLIRRRRQA